MFHFGLLSSIIPYIVLTVAYLFYLGACTVNKMKGDSPDEPEKTIVYTSEYGSQSAVDFYDQVQTGREQHSKAEVEPPFYPDISSEPNSWHSPTGPVYQKKYSTSLFSRPPPLV